LAESNSTLLTRGGLAVTGFVSILQGLLMLVPTFVLGAAINWPDSLDYSASELLPDLLEQEGAVRLGYTVYLIYSILFCVAIFTLTKLAMGKSMSRLMTLIMGFAAISTLSRSIGIVRWLVPMPLLAEDWAGASEQERIAISATYDSLNWFGGTVGEVLGVSIFAALTIFIISVAFLKDGLVPKWIGFFGFLAALSTLATASELLGFEPDTLVIVFGTTMVQFWFLGIGAWLLIKAARTGKSVSQGAQR
jgi:hypothetical protein